MRLRELTFPIAVLWPMQVGLHGGKGAGFSRWSSRFAMGYDKEYLNGAFDDAEIFDAKGRRFEVLSIELSKPDWWRLFLRSAGFLFVFPDRAKGHFTSVDMELREIGRFNTTEFARYLRDRALANPEWWQHNSSEDEISSLFRGRSTYVEIIDDIGVLGPSGRQNWPENFKGRSRKTIDHR